MKKYNGNGGEETVGIIPDIHRLASALHHSTDAIVLTDKEGIIVEINPAFTKMYGFREEEVLGETNRIVRSAQADASIYENMWQEIVENKQWKGELYNRTKDGREIPVYLSITPIYDGEELTGYMGLSIDLTDKYRIGEELQHEKRFTESLLNTANNLIVGLDTDGRITLFNDMCEEVTGYSRSEVMGKSWFEIFLPSGITDEVNRQFKRLLSVGEPKHFENEILTRAGERRLILWSNTAIKGDDGEITGTLSIGQDTTEYSLLRKKMGHSEQLAVLGQLAAGIAHEVGNPLTSISSIVQVLLRQVKDEAVIEKLNMIRGQTKRITHIIRELVDFSRPSEMAEEVTDVNEQVEKSLRIAQLDEKSKNVEFIAELSGNLPLISVIQDQLFQVILNLLLNALDALEGKNGVISVTTEMSGNAVIIVVKDSGKGISEEELTRIFDPFYTTKEVGKGTGLGLWVSQGIIDSFNGSIEIDSEVGVGSTFTIYLPIGEDGDKK